jgi:hypothetical protein
MGLSAAVAALLMFNEAANAYVLRTPGLFYAALILGFVTLVALMW